ncbi:MAG: L-ribulose-5-phosphate 4-epimerase [Clostridia bacterium]|nr:L-ribulose-5-phosphate 4-epimerase [Clostridia bacterium]
MLETLKRKVCEANIELQQKGLITYTWGNVSGIDRTQNLVVIKPSGVSYDELTYDKMVVVDLDGNKVEGDLSPSSDTATHLELYKKYPSIGGITHTHSNNATSWAQAGRNIPFFGTTHADYFHGDIPCTRMLTAEEINTEYEKNTGLVIIETLENNNIDPVEMPAILCCSHGPFTWGKDAAEAVHNAVVLEEVAEMAMKTLLISPRTERAPQVLSDKHYFRKHGANAYYGQK